MTTTVTITGTGVPFPSATRAGAGVLVRHGDVALQVDAGRSTMTRLVQAGVLPSQLSALLVTHLHSDHVMDLADLVLTRWVQEHLTGSGPLPLVLCGERARSHVERLIDAYDYDIDVRVQHVQEHGPELAIETFAAPAEPTRVWTSPDGQVAVDAVRVRHEPVEDAVGYRVTTPDGTVVVSGDTRVCEEIATLAADADLLVHEACRISALADQTRGTVFEKIFSYHADTVELGALAARLGLPHLALTHLIPAPDTPEQEAEFVADVRRGGYDGPLTVARDLQTFTLERGRPVVVTRLLAKETP
jgi:ribonuclease Z